MLHRKLSCSALKLSKHCNALSSPALLWAGNRQQAVLAFNPVNRTVCFTVDELQTFISNDINQSCLQNTGSINTSDKRLKAPATTNKGWHSFRSGWLGYFTYEAGHALMSNVNRTPNMPLAEFFEYAFSIVLDFKSDKCELFYRPEVNVSEVIESLELLLGSGSDGLDAEALISNEINMAVKQKQTTSINQWSPVWDAKEYQQAFNKVQAYLNAGDCYQVNLAMPFSNSTDMRAQNPLPLLQSFNPAFGGYLKTDYLSLFSVSPERFVCIDGERMETRPIKGTASRGANESEDEANKAWLAGSAKNQAENLMIVDLLRNDLSRYAQPFTVKVEKLFAIETHANVHHMVSTISASKRPEISSAEVILSALPGGSITGAPKKRAMEVIDELEAGARGPYCGVMGFFDDSGFVDFNILIRTVVATESGAECWAGGGVVLDSTCEEEWQELHVKVARILENF